MDFYVNKWQIMLSDVQLTAHALGMPCMLKLCKSCRKLQLVHCSGHQL